MHLGNSSGTDPMQVPGCLPPSSQPQSERTCAPFDTAFSHTCHQCCICGSSSLTLTLTVPYFPSVYWRFACHSDIGDYHVSYSILFHPDSFTYKYSLQGDILVNTGLLLRLSQVSCCCSESKWTCTYTGLTHTSQPLRSISAALKLVGLHIVLCSLQACTLSLPEEQTA